MNDEIKSLMSENEKLKAELANNALGDTADRYKWTSKNRKGNVL